MRINIVLLALVLLLPVLLGGIMRPSVPPVVQSAAVEKEALPEFGFSDLNGRKYRGGDFKGKVLLLNFWASWCLPCVHEFPALIEIARGRKDVTIVALSLDEKRETAAKFLKRFGGLPKNFIVGMDDGRKISHDVFQSLLLPETIIVTAEGRMSGKIAGGDWTKAQMEEEINSAFSKK